jgi:hypothetical protein
MIRLCYGELISTTILAHFMNHMGIKPNGLMLETSSKPILIIEMPQWDLTKIFRKCKKKKC